MAVEIWDYVVFTLFIVGSSLVPLYNRVWGPKMKTKADYVFAAESVSMYALMFSLARGTLGVRAFLGFPSELVYRGCAMWETIYGTILAYPIICFVFVPVYFNLKITSVYQYLDMRFRSRTVRRLASLTYVVRGLLTMGVTVFIPCIALKTVMGMPYWISIISISCLSITFNIMGGLTSAIHADIVQGIAMIACCVAIIIQGTLSVGGVAPVYKTALEGGRLDFFKFDTDPTIRVTAFSALFGQVFISVSVQGCQQNFVQRYCSMRSLHDVTIALMGNIPMVILLFSLPWVVGMVIFSNYADCDPLAIGAIGKIDEIVPFFLQDKFSFLPGFVGLFVACLLNGSLSIEVSNLNSLATVTWEDFLKHIPRCGKFSDAGQLLAIKTLGTLYGMMAAGVAFAVATLSGVIDTSVLMASATSGPMLGVFFLAMLVPCVNWKGAAGGMIIGHILSMWLTIGSLTLVKPPIDMLPSSIEECKNDTFSHINSAMFHQSRTLSNSSLVFSDLSTPLNKFYSISYMYYAVLGCTATVVAGIVISCFTGHSEADLYDEKLIHPLVLKISRLMPGKPRRYLSDNPTNRSADDNTNAMPVEQVFIISTVNDIMSSKKLTLRNRTVTENTELT